jgi:hypothetical protein
LAGIRNTLQSNFNNDQPVQSQTKALRTGSIGNRDAESLINTLVEPKKSILSKLRDDLLSYGYSEEAGYDPINVESYVSYSISGVTRFIFKHKWELVVLFVIANPEEKEKVARMFPSVGSKKIEVNDVDGTTWLSLDPGSEGDIIRQIAKSLTTVQMP